jgi:hypothetical protein
MYFNEDKIEYFKYTNALGQDSFYALYAASTYKTGVSFDQLTGNISVKDEWWTVVFGREGFLRRDGKRDEKPFVLRPGTRNGK